MSQKYYNYLEFKKIIKLIKTDPFLAKNNIEEYLKEYPNDYNAYCAYSYILIIFGNFDFADQILDDMYNKIQNDRNFQRNNTNITEVNYYYLLNKMRLLARREKYHELLKLYYDNYSILSTNPNLEIIPYICLIKLNNKELLLKYNRHYLYSQIEKYNEDDFLNHIKKHIADYCDCNVFMNNCVFLDEINVDELIEEIKKYIPSEKRLCTGFFDDSYYFRYDGCGRCDGRIQDYFNVITLQNAKDLVTMFPCSIDCKNLPYVDLNYLNSSSNNQSKVKKLSQTEKFYKRYNRH